MGVETNEKNHRQMVMDDNTTPLTAGEYAYRVYAQHRFQNQSKLLRWDKLPEYVQDAWEVMGAAMLDKKEFKK